MKLTASDGKSSRSSDTSLNLMKRVLNRGKKRFVICVQNKDYPASLQILKIYERLPDSEAEADGMIRIADEDGEDYLYPAPWFIPLEVSKEVAQALETAAELQSA